VKTFQRATSLLSIIAVAGIMGCASSAKHESTGQYVDDTTITSRVKTRFAKDEHVSASRIQIETLNGTVQLAGFVPTQDEKDRAGAIAREVPDVKDVRNNILVRPPTQ